jgi:hypothetical protein
VTLRVGDQLVGVRADTDATAERIRTVFAGWLEPITSAEHGEPVPGAFSLRLDPDRDPDPGAGRGPKPVPQLRIGRRLLVRSRRTDDVMGALDHVLGGVLARQDDTRRWLGLRTFVTGDRAVLVDAAPPALTADPRLARAGVTELPTWCVAVGHDSVIVPPPLTATTTTDEPEASTYRLVGLVGLDACGHGDHADVADHHPTNPGALLARFAARHPSNEWFHTVEELVSDGCVHATTDRTAAAGKIRRLLVVEDPTG